jgi:hypothetical protein
LVGNGRAVLIGSRPASAARLTLDGEPLDDPRGLRRTLYRFVFPVDREAGS